MPRATSTAATAFIAELAALARRRLSFAGALRYPARWFSKTDIPVVAVALPATQSEPGLFSSLAHPGGSLTGFSAFGEEMSAKRIEMLKEIHARAEDPRCHAQCDRPDVPRLGRADHRGCRQTGDRAGAIGIGPVPTRTGRRTVSQARRQGRHRYDRDPRLPDRRAEGRHLQGWARPRYRGRSASTATSRGPAPCSAMAPTSATSSAAPAAMSTAS